MPTFNIETGRLEDEPTDIDRRGNTLLSGKGPPDIALGKNGDFYIDTLNLTIYGPKNIGWGDPSSLRGPRGEAITAQVVTRGGEDQPGAAGQDGVGIVKLTQQTSESVEIVLSDGSSKVIVLPSGKDGADGTGIVKLTQKAPDSVEIVLSDGSSKVLVLPSGRDGREIQLGRNRTHVQWRYVGTDAWFDLFLIPRSLKGGTGGGVHKHEDLFDMPDDKATNADHDLRYLVHVGTGLPEFPEELPDGFLIFDTDEPSDCDFTTATKTENYTASLDDEVIEMDATGGNRSVFLFDATLVQGKSLRIKKVDVTANTVTLVTFEDQTIDLAASKTLTEPDKAYHLISNDLGNWSRH